jgi:epoxyqueuosine reductase
LTEPPLEDRLKSYARSLGFDLAGVAPATEADGFARLQEWLARGYAGEMNYLHRHEEARRHPGAVFHEVKSVVMLGHRYSATDRSPKVDALVGRVASYAQGPDYHDVLREKLDRLLEWLQTQVPGCTGRGVVDTAPLLERDFARRAGLGWLGKNTMLIDKRHGSFLFLAALLVNLELRSDRPHAANHCGSCTRCLDACPTQAFSGPGWLDARKCISYLTIELKSSIPEGLREPMGDWLFGCDVCQEVCPWNRRQLGVAVDFPHQAGFEAIDLLELISLDEAQFRQRFRSTPMMRSKRKGLIRNALIVLGNVGDERAVEGIRRCLGDEEPLIREAAAWALGRIAGRYDEAGPAKLET